MADDLVIQILQEQLNARTDEVARWKARLEQDDGDDEDMKEKVWSMLRESEKEREELEQEMATGRDHHHEVPVKAVLVPKELYEHIVEAGVTKSKWRLDKQIVMGLIAGFYIGFSFMYTMIIGGQIPGLQHGENPGIYNLLLGSFGFPLGLFMICVVGADLFTSNCSYMITAVHEGRCTWGQLAKNWVVSWFVNLAGSIIMAEIVTSAAIFEGRSDYILYAAHKKTGYTFSVCMCKAILANWLVNLAVWIANSAQDVTGKAIGIYLPISAFIAIGGEHCIANQFLFSLAKLYGFEMSVRNIIVKNLIPATIGNIIGGVFFVGTLYSCALGSLLDTMWDYLYQAADKIAPTLSQKYLRRGDAAATAATATTATAPCKDAVLPFPGASPFDSQHISKKSTFYSNPAAADSVQQLQGHTLADEQAHRIAVTNSLRSMDSALGSTPSHMILTIKANEAQMAAQSSHTKIGLASVVHMAHHEKSTGSSSAGSTP